MYRSCLRGRHVHWRILFGKFAHGEIADDGKIYFWRMKRDTGLSFFESVHSRHYLMTDCCIIYRYTMYMTDTRSRRAGGGRANEAIFSHLFYVKTQLNLTPDPDPTHNAQ
jgi:hypothetical protein